ncbi:hypothetical protein JL722_7601 [Aureococcus anophagefferens]|nr:hypothetical protein JL722_7601 [Aureococcus anophagefferens]
MAMFGQRRKISQETFDDARPAADGKAAAAARAALVAAQGLAAIGRLARACVGDDDAVGDRDTEAVKAAFVKLKLCPLLVKAVDLAVAENDETLAFDACAALVAAAAADDLRSVTSAAFDTSRALVDAGAVACLFKALAAFGARGRDAGAKDATLGALDALRQIAKSDDAVKLIRKAGGAKACLAALKENRTSRDRCRKLAGLLRNLAGNDDAKDAMCKDGTLEELLGAMERFLKDDAVLCEHVVACLAQMALRRPKNGTLIVEGRNGGTLVIHAMTHHKAHAGLMRQGALALRNFTNVGVAYAALRDLGIDAKVKTFVPDDAGGFKEADAPMTFGAESAKNFNRESSAIAAARRDSASAPWPCEAMELDLLKCGAAGAAAGLVCDTLLYPLDLARANLNAPRPTTAPPLPAHPLRALAAIFRELPARRLFRGYACVPYFAPTAYALYFGAYEYWSRTAESELLAGFSAEATANPIYIPTTS